TVQGYLRNPHRQIRLIPVYIGYEKVVEGRTYLGELRGKTKKGESILGLLKAAKTLKEHFGKVSLAFGEPIDLKKTLDQTIPDWQQADNSINDKPQWLPDAVSALSQQVATGINNSATLNGANLCALGLLTAPSFTLESSSLSHFIHFCQKLHNQLRHAGDAPVNHQTTEQLIAEAEKLELITRLPHTYGDLLQLNEQQALLMTWYRNNILHLFALPSLVAFCFNQQSQYTRKQLQDLVGTLYPFVSKELYLPWQGEALNDQVDAIVRFFIEQQVLVDDGEHLVRISPYQEQGALLTLLARPIQPSLERGYLMVALLLHFGSGSFTAEALENECQVLAQRLSILHGLNAPEYFHKPLFRQLTELLLELDYLQVSEDGHLTFGQTLEWFSVQCRTLFDPALRHSIRLLTHQPKLAQQEQDQ
ncbi:glycerol-3-phosphate 1-O-acyltransferase, partial [Oceanospirillum sp. HFRX-1_2]